MPSFPAFTTLSNIPKLIQTRTTAFFTGYQTQNLYPVGGVARLVSLSLPSKKPPPPRKAGQDQKRTDRKEKLRHGVVRGF